jgi:choline dehydrogenase-like flavoprotein
MRDVIVIGAGGCGPVAAKELAAQGLDVLLLEGGPRHTQPREEWSLLENDASHVLTGYLRVGPGDRSKPAWYRELPQNSFLWQVAGVGGTTQHYFGNSPRAYPGVFNDYTGEDAGNYDAGHLFPFGYADLVPYYEWVEATLPVHTAPMGTKETFYFKGCETLGIPVQKTKTTTEASYRPQENAILPPGGNAGRTTDRAKLAYPLATGCTFCGHCIQGCMQPIDVPRNQTARRSTDNSYVPMALTADVWSPHGKPVSLVADAMVTKIHTGTVDGQLSATGVTWRDNSTGEAQREDARVVILSAGAVESPRLWLTSGLPNPNDWVGRGLTDHYVDLIFGVLDDNVGNSKGPHSSARCDFPGYGALQNMGIGPAVQALAMAFSDSGIRGEYTNGGGFRGTWDGLTGRLPAEELKDVLLNGLDRILNVVTLTDDDVQADNRVTLSAMPADENGSVPKVRMDSRGRSDRTVRNREYLAHRSVELLRGAGAQKVYRVDLAPMMLHVHSTMRMGSGEADSVLDEHAESRAVKRLFVADNSALPNSLGGPNPTLTSQALATRTAERIFQAYFGGDAWVRSQAPVVSTDERITHKLAELGE